jgi:hypothetical protein
VELAAETLVWNTVTTDAAFPRHVANAQLRMLQAQPGTIVLEVVLAPAILLSLSDGWLGAVVVLCVVALVALLHVVTRTQLRRLLPAGSVYRAALGANTLLTEAPLGNAALPYGVLGRIRVSRHVVLLQNSRGKQWLPLPREVFPGPVLDELRERIRAAPPAAAVESRGIVAPGGAAASWTTDPGYPKRVSRALVAESLLTKRCAGTVALLLTAVVALTVAIDAPAGTALMFVGLFVALLVFVYALTGLSLRRRMAKQIPTGSTLQVAVGEEHLRIEGPATSGEMSYAAFRGLQVRGDIVLLRTVQAGQFVALPAQLFTEQSLRELRSRIAGADEAR